MKKTLTEKLGERKVKKPSFLYPLIGGVYGMIFKKKYNIHVKYNYDVKKEKGPYIFVSNHASRVDYMFTMLPLLPNRYNVVVGYNEFFRSHLKGILSMMQCIPKRNFTPDFYTMKTISKILKSNGKLVIFPEGMSSISGANQPVAVGTGKFIKKFKLPVYYSIIKGGYLTSPKYNLDERYGKIEVVFDKMFSAEELENLSPEEIEDIMNKKLYHDDYLWNKQMKIKYKHNGEIATNLHHLLYWCPKCGKEFSMVGKGNTIKCSCCGNGATILDTYEMIPFDDSCVIPNTQTEWFNLERENVKKEILDENFELVENVKLGMLPAYKPLKNLQTSEIVGSGRIILNRNGFTYEGTKNGEAFKFHLDSSEVPTYGMCTDLTRFYTFYKGEFMEFYPENETVEKWFLATEEIHRLNGGKWQDFKFDK